MDYPQQRIELALKRVDKIDFSLIRMKLADELHGPAWSKEDIDAAQEEYAHFLALTYAYPDEPLVPSALADEYWHYHILDTRAYAQDCEQLFGFFLHHFPYLGLRGPDDARRLEHHAKRTNALHAKHFAAVTTGSVKCATSACASCANIDTRFL